MLMYADFGLKCCILVASRVTKTTGISGFSLGLLDYSLIVEVESTFSSDKCSSRDLETLSVQDFITLYII